MNANYNQPPTQNPFGNINQSNPVFNNFGGYQNFMNGFNSFAQQMLNSGQMSQQQFEWCRQMANSILGMSY